MRASRKRNPVPPKSMPLIAFSREVQSSLHVFWPLVALILMLWAISVTGSWLGADLGWDLRNQAPDSLTFSAAWVHYLLLATVFPSVLFCGWRLLPRFKQVLGEVGLALVGLSGIALISWALSDELVFWVAGLALLQAGMVAFARKRLSLVSLLGDWVIAWIGWRIALRVIWWTSWDKFAFAKPGGGWIFAGISLSALAVFLVLAPKLSKGLERGLEILLAGVAAGVILVFSFKLPAADVMLSHHWSVFTGPAELLKRGYLLYWDFPSQYGLLSTIALSLLPTASTWHSLYFLNSAFLFLSGMGMYFLVGSLKPGPHMKVLAFLAALAAVFILPGDALLAAGPNTHPSVAAFRFIWVYALCGLLLLWASEKLWSSRSPNWIVAGSILWLLGSLWSSESAIYCCACWFFPHVLYFIEAYKCGEKINFKLFMMPILMLLASVALLQGASWTVHGHFGDFSAFFESGFSFAGGFGYHPLSQQGPYVILLLPVLVLVAIILGRKRTTASEPTGAAAIGIALGAWAICSYFVGRSHPNNATNLMPIVLLGCSAAVRLCENELKHPVRMLVAPMLCVLCFIPLNHGVAWNRLSQALGTLKSDVWSAMPQSQPDLEALLSQSGFKKRDGLAVIGVEGDPYIRGEAAYAWLPLLPYSSLVPLAPERRMVYMKRFLDGQPMEGDRSYFIASDHSFPAGHGAWVHDFLANNGIRVINERRQGRWILQQYAR